MSGNFIPIALNQGDRLCLRFLTWRERIRVLLTGTVCFIRRAEDTEWTIRPHDPR
jgi:hypothetical protein